MLTLHREMPKEAQQEFRRHLKNDQPKKAPLEALFLVPVRESYRE